MNMQQFFFLLLKPNNSFIFVRIFLIDSFLFLIWFFLMETIWLFFIIQYKILTFH